MKDNPLVPGGPSKSEPTWLNAFGCLATSVLFLIGGALAVAAGRDEPHG